MIWLLNKVHVSPIPRQSSFHSYLPSIVSHPERQMSSCHSVVWNESYVMGSPIHNSLYQKHPMSTMHIQQYNQENRNATFCFPWLSSCSSLFHLYPNHAFLTYLHINFCWTLTDPNHAFHLTLSWNQRIAALNNVFQVTWLFI